MQKVSSTKTQTFIYEHICSVNCVVEILPTKKALD